jgi:hypothetical protein
MTGADREKELTKWKKITAAVVVVAAASCLMYWK